MKVIVFGASGIVGQHLRLCTPPSVTPVWFRRTADPITRGFDLVDSPVAPLLDSELPNVVVNLAGESSVDAVERDPDRYYTINVLAPMILAQACAKRGIRYIHISSQAVFDGDRPPYGPASPAAPVNEYGSQKVRAEAAVEKYPTTTILRLSFILGVRPLPYVGRKNPLEAMLDGSQPQQTCDRFFSPLFARDAAELIWREIVEPSGEKVRHFGVPQRWSRAGLAECLGVKHEAVSSDTFPDIAPRPVDTTYDASSLHDCEVESALVNCAAIRSRISDRATELSLFFGIPYADVFRRLSSGFGHLHNEVTEDFRRSGANENDAESLLNWYRTTDAYIWELSAYHEDPGFNYAGMVRGIVERLRPEVGDGHVLCLGDGIGDLTIAVNRTPMAGIYHDLQGSRTADYARFRFWRQTGCDMPSWSTDNFDPLLIGNLKAVVSLDFLEHVPNVDTWVYNIHHALVPGGLFFAQNAFACGSGPSGPIPMHLSVNDRYEHDWDPLLASVGFEAISSNWYRKARSESTVNG